MSRVTARRFNVNITSAKYVDDEDGKHLNVTIVVDGATLFVPLDEANTDYQAILAWVADGNTIQDAD